MPRALRPEWRRMAYSATTLLILASWIPALAWAVQPSGRPDARVAELDRQQLMRFDSGIDQRGSTTGNRNDLESENGDQLPILHPDPAILLPMEDNHRWTDEFAPPSGTGTVLNGTVWALLEYQGNLVVGGNFTSAGGVSANHIALWDETSWQQMGAGLNGTVFALAVYGRKLIAGGTFTQADGRDAYYIASWDGSSWDPIDGGVDGPVYALLAQDSDLIVGGDFYTAGAVPARKIARWDGKHWAALGVGFNGGYRDYGVRALTAYNGEIVAGGFFTWTGNTPLNRIGSWDGVQWNPIGNWTNDTVYSLTVSGTTLVAGAVVWRADLGTWTNMIAEFVNGAWVPMASGTLDYPFPNAVRAFATFDDQLVAAGQFPRAGGTVVNYIATWDGAAWNPLGSGMNAPVYAVVEFQGKLYAGGDFTTAGGQHAEHLAAWDGQAWSALPTPPGGQGLNGTVWALKEFQGQLIAGGSFTQAGPVSASGIAGWDGSTWTALGSGIQGTVFALAEYGNALFAGGSFSEAGGRPIAYLARWDGTAWSPVGDGPNGPVRALLVHDGNLIVGGDFSYADSLPAQNIASWNGSEWSALGTGLYDGDELLGVRALFEFNGQITAGGFFSSAGDVALNFIAKWDGDSWSTIGEGLSATVYSLAEFNGDLIAGSTVWHSPEEGTWADLIRRWDGHEWTGLDDGELVYPFPNALRAMLQFEDDLIAAGQFPDAAGHPVNFVASWNGHNWKRLGSGLDFWAYALAEFQGDLYVGGEFHTAGGKPSASIARWQAKDGHASPQNGSSPVARPQSRLTGINPLESGAYRIDFTIGGAGSPVKLEIYDVGGRRIVTLLDAVRPAGGHFVTWNGRDQRSRAVSRGVYFVRFNAGPIRASQKLVLLSR